jgi:hypothetical protein
MEDVWYARRRTGTVKKNRQSYLHRALRVVFVINVLKSTFLPITALMQFWDLYWVALTVQLAEKLSICDHKNN